MLRYVVGVYGRRGVSQAGVPRQVFLACPIEISSTRPLGNQLACIHVHEFQQDGDCRTLNVKRETSLLLLSARQFVQTSCWPPTAPPSIFFVIMGDILCWIRRTANLSATRTELPWPGWLDADAARALTASSTTHQFTLSAPERQWVHIQPWLDSQGYLLRPRFRQGWTPSWPKSAMTNPLRLESRHEDAIQHDVSCIYPK